MAPVNGWLEDKPASFWVSAYFQVRLLLVFVGVYDDVARSMALPLWNDPSIPLISSVSWRRDERSLILKMSCLVLQ